MLIVSKSILQFHGMFCAYIRRGVTQRN